jgi:formylmethanofuran dehydrogenase subunit E
MARWSWHHKNGVRVGVIGRITDTLMPIEHEREIYERHGRELHYQEHHPPGLIYQSFRTCADCGHKYRQNDMLWTGKRLLCSRCYDEALKDVGLDMMP